MEKCEQEIYMQEQTFAQRMNKTSKLLLEQKSQIKKLSDSLKKQTNDQPWVYQKCALRGLFLAKECLRRIGEESNTLCQQELFAEMNKMSKQLDIQAEAIKQGEKLRKQQERLLNFRKIAQGENK